MNLIHTDLKLENILFVKSDYRIAVSTLTGKTYREPLDYSVKLIDFGGSIFNNDNHSKIVNTRQYRAPEVILGLEWSFPSDMWSVGCILAELYIGEMLFPTHDDGEHLAMMEKITETHLPASMHQRALKPFIESIARRENRRSRSNPSSNRNSRRGNRSRDDSPRRTSQFRARKRSHSRSNGYAYH